MLRRTFLALGPALGAALLLPERAHASSLLGLNLEELVERSAWIGLAETVARQSEWADDGGRRRIVTRTRLLHREIWASPSGSASEAESEVITWGGRVGRVAQKVHGEAQLPSGAPLLLFLSGEDAAARRVVGLGQGEFRLREQAGRQKLEPVDPALGGALLHSGKSRNGKSGGGGGKPLAFERLHGLGPREARGLIEQRWQELGR
ncbi:MAG TPA: hypothetical protein VLC09_21420 [Polyangiaceae bacterium]|nr:hypothetical protein [Polyangiaceae bacterium]